MKDKYPLLAFQGERVTTDQAAEILIRCDTFQFGCNEIVEREVWRSLGIGPRAPWVRKGSNRRRAWKEREWSRLGSLEWARMHALKESTGNLWLQELETHRIMDSGGPYGWCDWDGTIDHAITIGKWPELEHVREDFETIAREWPFLRMTAQLYEGDTPILDFLVKDGAVTLREATGVLFAPKPRPELGMWPRVEKRPGERLNTYKKRYFEAYKAKMVGIDLDVLRGHIRRLQAMGFPSYY